MDIAVIWDAAHARGDWSIANGDLALGSPLLSAIMVSLFSDRVAPAQPTADDQAAGIGVTGGAQDDRRGWWGDVYIGRPIGSRLWQLARAIKTGTRQLPQDAEDICSEALQWLLDDNVVSSFSVAASWAAATSLLIAVSVFEPNARTAQTFQFQFAWEGI